MANINEIFGKTCEERAANMKFAAGGYEEYILNCKIANGEISKPVASTKTQGVKMTPLQHFITGVATLGVLAMVVYIVTRK